MKGRARALAFSLVLGSVFMDRSLTLAGPLVLICKWTKQQYKRLSSQRYEYLSLQGLNKYNHTSIHSTNAF